MRQLRESRIRTKNQCKPNTKKQLFWNKKSENWFSPHYTHIGEKKKYKAHILKYVPCILKYLRHIFCFLWAGSRNGRQKRLFFGALIFIKALPPKKVAWLDRFRCCAIGERPVYVFPLRNWRHIRFRIGSQMI